MNNIQEHLGLLGRIVKDRVTGLAGVVTSISFDLYGCIQATVHPGLDKDSKPRDQHWFDVARLEVIATEPVMSRPDFGEGYVAEGKKGPAEKPAMSKT